MPTYRSRTTTAGRNMAGARALWRATGMTDADFGKPIIAVALTDEELAARRRETESKGMGYRPAEIRPRKVTTALKVYASMATSADKGAVRDLSRLTAR